MSGARELTLDDIARPSGEVAHDRVSLAFKGNARDYFRLWIVNLCLTLLTFGIFSAWAKVRRKRYFYSHTELLGVPFEYLASPIPILKGRLIGFVLLALWYAGTHFSIRLLVGVLIVALLLAPWAMVRTAAFNARYSAYRNMTFQFSGSYGGAAGALVVGMLLTAFTCGLGYPWAMVHVRRYFVERTSFGGIPARFTARGGHLFLPYLCIMGSLLASGAALGVLKQQGADFEDLLTPALAVGYLLYGLGYAFWTARVSAVNWRHTAVGPLRFTAHYRARDFVSLYFVNALAILGSLGLLVPWAAVRLYRYRIERLEVDAYGPLTAFAGQAGTSVRATGAEVMDLFDFDLSL
jgi:uncharacterized membrane protein YjgN (DUF898 family)